MKQLFASAIAPEEGNQKFILPGLDGLRAIAVSLVIVYHLWPTVVPGGMIGVDIFFVISGYLITALLLREGATTGRINLLEFWKRRARRLLPAIALVILLMGPITQIMQGDIRVALDRQVLGAATFSSNWLSILSGNDYFTQTSPQLFTNFWSLAVEEQFYVIWPLLLVAVALILQRRWRLFAIAVGVLVVFSLTISTVLAAGEAPLSRVYYGTDTHMYGLLSGVLLAFAVPWSLYPPVDKHVLYTVSRPYGMVTFARVLISWVCLFALIPYAVLAHESAKFFIPWGLFGASLLTIGVIQGMLPDMVVGASELLRKVLSFPPLLWIGQRSYGLYLWHWPLAVIAHYLYGPDRSPLINLLVLALTLAVAELSYRFVETPVRRYGFRGCARMVWQWLRTDRMKLVPLSITVVVTGACFASTAMAVHSAPQMTSAQTAVENGKKAAQERLQAKKEARASASASATADPQQSQDPSAAPSPGPSGDSQPKVDSSQVTIIGDSIVVATQPDLYDTMPDAQVDAEEGRTIDKVIPIVKSMASNGQLRKTVVISVAANSTFAPGQLEQILETLPQDSKLVVVTGFGPSNLTWIENSNSIIREFAQKNSSRVVLADWNSTIREELQKNPTLMTSDGVHPDLSGQVIYARVVTEAVAKAQS